MPKLVPSIGPITSKICLIGEAPGKKEEQQGVPFVGPSGKLLTQLLSSVGLSREDIHIRNVISERPPNNDISHFIDLSSNPPKISPKGQEYLDELYNIIPTLSANVFVPLGNVSLWALTGLTEITKRRGSILTMLDKAGSTRKVIPTIHPAASLRGSYLYRFAITWDLEKIKEESKYPELTSDPITLIINPSMFQIELSLIHFLRFATKLAFDIEVSLSTCEITMISFSDQVNSSISIPFIKGSKHCFSAEEETWIWEQIAKIMENPDIEKIAQNAIFDASYHFRKLNIVPKNLHCTMLAHGILLPTADKKKRKELWVTAFPKALDFLTSLYTKITYYKDEAKEYYDKGIKNWDSFCEYNAKDSLCCSIIFPQQLAELKEQKNLEAYERQRALIEPLIFMGEHGILVDVEAKQAESFRVLEEIRQTREQVQELLGDINPQSPKQLMKYFYEVKGEKAYIKRGTGKPTIDEDALERLSIKGYEEARLLLRIRSLEKLRNTYLETPLDGGRLLCSFDPSGTISGRLSSRKTSHGTGSNFQNLDPRVKRYLVADNGYFLCSLDLKQAENKVIAYIAPEPQMIRAFETGTDIHAQTASLIYQKAIKDITHEERQMGKKANHGLNYGLGYKKFSFINGLKEKEGKEIVDKYHRVYPGIREYHKWIQADLDKERTLENCFGRKRVFFSAWGSDLFLQANSFIPQSTVAEITNQRGIRYIYEHQDLFSEVILLNCEHDSLSFELPIHLPLEKTIEILLNIKNNLEQPISWKYTQFTIPAELKIGMNFAPTDKENNPLVDKENNPLGMRKVSWDLIQAKFAGFFIEYFERNRCHG